LRGDRGRRHGRADEARDEYSAMDPTVGRVSAGQHGSLPLVPGETCHLSRAVTTVPIAASYLTFTDLTVHQALMTISLAANVPHVVFDGIYTREWLAGATFTGTGVVSIGFRSDVTGIAHVFLYGTIMAEIDTYVPATEAPVRGDLSREQSFARATWPND
jgi:hypothetical protein